MLTGLIIDEQRNQHQSLRPALYQSFGKEADSAYTLNGAEQFIDNKVYDYMVVDPNTESMSKTLNLLLRAKADGRIKPFCVILVVSSDSSSSFVASCADLAPDDFLVKPTKIADLITRLTAAVERKAILKAPYMEYARTGRVAEAQKLFEKALKSSRTNIQQVQALRAMAQFSSEQANIALAMQMVQKLRAISNAPQAKIMQAEVLLANGEEAKSIEILEEVLADHPMLLTGYDLLAEARYLKGEGELGLRAREKANSISPLNATRSDKLSREAYDLGKLDLARETLVYQLDHIPDLDAGSRMALLAQVHLAQNNVEEGVAVLEMAQKRLGAQTIQNSPILTIAMLNAAHNQGHSEVASNMLARLIQLDEATTGPKPYLCDAAFCAYRLGDKEQGSAWLERVLSRQSQSYSQFQRIKETMVSMGLDEELARISRHAAKTRAAHAERVAQFRQAEMFMDLAQDMIDLAEHPDADIATILDALQAIAEAKQKGQLHQGGALLVDSLSQRVEALGPNAQQENQLHQILRRFSIR